MFKMTPPNRNKYQKGRTYSSKKERRRTTFALLIISLFAISIIASVIITIYSMP